MDRTARYERYVRPYTKPLLILEYLCVPVFNLILIAFGGSVPLAIAAGLTWLICDVLFTTLTGCSLFGICLQPSPAELGEPLPEFARGRWNYLAYWFMFMLFFIFLLGGDIYLLYLMPGQRTWLDGIRAIFFIQNIYWLAYLRLRFIGGTPDLLKKYDKHLLVFSGALLISLIIFVAMMIESASYRIILMIISLVLAAIVIYYTYRLIVEAPWRHAI